MNLKNLKVGDLVLWDCAGHTELFLCLKVDHTGYSAMRNWSGYNLTTKIMQFRLNTINPSWASWTIIETKEP